MANAPHATWSRTVAFETAVRSPVAAQLLASLSRGRSHQRVRTAAVLAALLAIPLILLWANGVWIANHYGDADTWFYHGHFIDLWNKSLNLGQISFDYYRTRLPYIIPGSLIYRIFGESLAPAVFSVVVVYGATIGSFWYVLSRHTSRPAAFAGTALLACDLYFLRSMGWQYVDNGVIAYQTLAFALITAAAQPRNNAMLFNAAAGCAAASMLFTHLGSSILAPVFVAYEYFLISRTRTSESIARRMLKAGTAAAAGAFGATVFYSLLNAAIYHVGPLFMLIQQLSVAEKELDRNHTTILRSGVLDNGFWLTVHFSVLIACGAVLARFFFLSSTAWRKRATEIFFLIALAASILIAIYLEVVNVAYYLLRDGEYISFYLPLTYFALTFLLFKKDSTSWRCAAMVWVLAIASAALRLRMADGNALPHLPHVPMAMLAVSLGLALVAARIATNTRLAMPIVAVFIGLTLTLPCPFVRDDNIAYTEQAIRGVSGDRIPHIYFDRNDPVGAQFMASVTGSFTERAWLQHGSAYPDLSVTENSELTHFHGGDLIVVLSSTMGDVAQVRANVQSYVGKVELASSMRLERPGFALWVHCFELPDDTRALEAANAGGAQATPLFPASDTRTAGAATIVR